MAPHFETIEGRNVGFQHLPDTVHAKDCHDQATGWVYNHDQPLVEVIDDSQDRLCRTNFNQIEPV